MIRAWRRCSSRGDIADLPSGTRSELPGPRHILRSRGTAEYDRWPPCPHDLPPITIITPCRTASSSSSTRSKACGGGKSRILEHIVADALSTDATLSLVARYPDLIVLPGPDAGSRDARSTRESAKATRGK